ncbi:ArsR/SmtB family transcription factor [Cryptosporangium phraense]|uniref:Metalloregulator ArsR/SmtB family transcription factor n=1 Tax=Cryptosporangium phraense TaxID=2593070 RepID=A0A545AXN1_9ACTN|nr:metalloregulator ArsR/SmtB family transcription factor [Cryptosporangium phraense]TQS46097.1 metalloregulator ArsR/SmtB family transcription factor [Cryptosporangium phraense]
MDDPVFKALADPSRRLLLDRLNERNGQSLRELCADLDLTRQAVSKHLAVLEAAGLIRVARHGREKLHYLDAGPITAIADRWITRYHRPHARALADLENALENPMGSTEFVYTTYIRTTPERLWKALQDPGFTRAYWGVEFRTDWTPDAPMTWAEKGTVTEHPDQRVLVAEPYRRLSYTWHTFTPEWAQAMGVDEQTRATIAAEPRSTVTFDLEPAEDGVVKLTVVHGDLDADGLLPDMLRGGWSRLLSDLKTLLETGRVLAEAK